MNKRISPAARPTGVSISATIPYPNWPGIAGGLDDQSTTAVAADVANTAGAIGAVEPQYAGVSSNPSKNVALVENASGDFTAPTPLDVTSALAYAAPENNGSQDLDFNGLGANVYNPSTFSYLLTPTTGWPPADGQTMSAFVNYALTLGQQIAPAFGYASLGQPLERFGINEVNADVPGAVPMTAAEQAFYNCGDLTPTDVAAGLTTPSCNPGNGLPETPYAIALPVVGLAAFGGAYLLRRRRVVSAVS